MVKRRINNEEQWFWRNEQTTQRVSVRTTGEGRRANSVWRQRADRKARTKRPLPMRLGQVLSRSVVWRPASLTVSIATTFFRER
jgi:hypothetical protein